MFVYCLCGCLLFYCLLIVWSDPSEGQKISHAGNRHLLGEHKPGRIKPGRLKRAALSLQNPKYYICFLLGETSQHKATTGSPNFHSVDFHSVFQWIVTSMFRLNFTCRRYSPKDCHLSSGFFWEISNGLSTACSNGFSLHFQCVLWEISNGDCGCFFNGVF